METIRCTDLKNVNHCQTCLSEDTIFKHEYKGKRLEHCCTCLIRVEIEADNREEPKENDCQ